MDAEAKTAIFWHLSLSCLSHLQNVAVSFNLTHVFACRDDSRNAEIKDFRRKQVRPMTGMEFFSF